jgi:hypothetical protein
MRVIPYCSNVIDQETRVPVKIWSGWSSQTGTTILNQSLQLIKAVSVFSSQWCKRGKCVEKYTEGPDAIDGGWSNWSQDYTECTRSCSGGVQYRTRQCSNPL